MMKRLFIFLFAPFLLLLSCTSPSPKSNKPLVVVAIPPYVNLVEEIGDDFIDVASVLSPDDNPHTFEPKPRQMDALAHARLFIGVGEPFEASFIKALKKTNPSLQVIDLSQVTPPSGNDRHIWMSPLLVQQQMQRITPSIETLLLAKDVPELRKNAAELQSELQELNESIQSKMRPFVGQALLVSHPSFGYFCDQYYLIQVPVESEGKDPLPRQLETILQLKRTKTFRCAFVVPQGAGKGTRQIAKRIGIPVYTFNPLAEDYFSNMKHLADLIAQDS